MVLNGIKSNKIAVSSGVPQGSVLGPILFLAYINDLSDQVKSRVRLFADDTAIYLAISSEGELITLQNDLHTLEKLEPRWDMSFNPSKCQVLHEHLALPPSDLLQNKSLSFSLGYIGEE